MWAYESVFYQIYPLGFCGAPFENDGIPESRILKVMDWIPHLNQTPTGTIQGTIERLIRDWERMKIFARSATPCMRMESG